MRDPAVVPFDFEDDGVVFSQQGQCRVEVAKGLATTTYVSDSSISSDGRCRIVIGDVFDFEAAYLLDFEICKSVHLHLPRYVQPWVSWSPDGSKVLFYTNYEASPQLWILKLDTGQILEVHHTGLAPRRNICCGLNEWAPKSGVGYLVPESVRWNGAAKFTFRLEIYCNPYSEEGGWPCGKGDNDNARAAYEGSVALETVSVTIGPMIRLPVRPRPQKDWFPLPGAWYSGLIPQSKKI